MLSTLISHSRNMDSYITSRLLLRTLSLRFLPCFLTDLSYLMLIVYLYFTYFILLNFTTVITFYNEKKM